METNPTDVDKTVSLCLLFFHGISVPLPIILDPLIDAISANDAKVSQSISGEVEDLGISVMCLHEIVRHDGDETLRITTHAIQDVLLQYPTELAYLIEYEIDRFHFLIALLTR